MNINYNISIEEICNIVLTKAKFQKVAICFDANSDLDFIHKIEEKLKKQVVMYLYNFDNFENVNEVVNDGIKCLISLLSFKNYLRLKSSSNFNFLFIDIVVDNFISPHLKADNITTYLFMNEKQENKLADILYLFANLVEERFYNISNSRNYGKEETILNQILQNFNNENIDLKNLVNLVKDIDFRLDFKECQKLNSIEEVAFYYYAIILAYKHLFLQFSQKSYKIIDVYKQYQNDYNQINLSHKILFDERLIFLLKTNNCNMIEFIDLFLNKINFKLLKNNNKINIKNILKILKNNIILLNKDNLLKISYLYGIFDAI